MNWHQIEGNWELIKGGLRAQWSKLTGDEIESIKGSKEKLVGLLQEKCGLTHSAAEEAVEDWRKKLER